MISAVILSTFYLENYGDAEKPYWKPKGGYDYWLCKFEHEEGIDVTFLANGFSELISRHTTRNSTSFIEMMQNLKLIPCEEAEALTIETEENYQPLEKTETSYVIYRQAH